MRVAVCAGIILCLAGCTAPARFDPRTITNPLERILDWHRKNAPAIASTLSPGLSRSEIAEFARKRKIVLPEEMYVLYGWRNGMRERLPLFDVYQFLPLAEAFEFGDMLHQAAPREPYRLPIFQSTLSNDGYDVECSRAKVEFFLDGTPAPDMDSLGAFVRALAASFDKGVFTASADGLETNFPEFQRTLMDFRPERKADMQTVLRGTASSLPVTRQTQAYSDLVLTENSRAEELIAQGMDRWLYNPSARYAGLIQLARLKTPTSLALLQQAAADSDRDVRRDAYSVLAWQTHWGGRKLDENLEKIAMWDLMQPQPRTCDRREIARVLRWAPDTRPVAALVATLRLLDLSDDPCARDTRIALALALGQLGDRSAVGPLANRLKNETDPGTQLSIESALADLGDGESERKLRARMEALPENSIWNLSRIGAGVKERRIATELYARFKKQSRADRGSELALP